MRRESRALAAKGRAFNSRATSPLPRGVMANALDPESSNRGLNPREAFCLTTPRCVSARTAHRSRPCAFPRNRATFQALPTCLRPPWAATLGAPPARSHP